MSNPVITSKYRFRWAESRMARWAGWPVLIGLWIVNVWLLFPASVHFDGGFFQNLWNMPADKSMTSWFMWACLPLTLSMVICGRDTKNGLLERLNKGPDWVAPSIWYAESLLILILWIAVDGSMRITMPYWIIGVTIGFLLVSRVLAWVIPEKTIKPQPIALPKPEHIRRDGLLTVSPWTNLLRGQRTDLWERYIEEARAAGRDRLADTIRAMLEDIANKPIT